MKRVLVAGTFDILHKGHEYFLRESKKFGDYLIVVIARDVTLIEVKKPYKNDENTRLMNIKKSPIVNEAVLGYEGSDKLRIIVEKNPDVICIGYDQTFFTEMLKERLKERGCNPNIVKIEAFKPELYKSSKIRKNSL